MVTTWLRTFGKEFVKLASHDQNGMAAMEMSSLKTLLLIKQFRTLEVNKSLLFY